MGTCRSTCGGIPEGQRVLPEAPMAMYAWVQVCGRACRLRACMGNTCVVMGGWLCCRRSVV
jgi:hypothetical protein